ncbi:GPCR, family 2-like protein [Metarhizium rileyi]|uniref:GPCR, family 2-like protein n=1 Tax=Metarhizium rileyi (strain RCEF 4871) TaxID=1649241 RepID=A0A167CXK9_METRR|nr:GPCR, family 2-like protein [Metarhizium rileyi RCEF 4871]
MLHIRGDEDITVGQNKALEIVGRTASVLSALGIVTIIAVFCLLPHFRNPMHRIIFINAFYNAFDVVCTMISVSGPAAGSSSALCQLQAFLNQMFPLADVLWTLAMAINVFLIVFRRYDGESLKRLEWKYMVVITALTFIPAFAFLFIHSEEKGPLYGSVTLWCSIAPKWVLLRIVFYYVPIWFMILIAMVIYCLVGIEILRRRVVFHSFNSNSVPLEDNLVSAARTSDCNYQSRDIEQNINSEHRQPFALHSGEEWQNLPSKPRMTTASHTVATTTHQSSAPHNSSLSFRQYVLMPVFCFLALLSVWVAPSTNRVGVFVRPDFSSFPLLLCVGATGSLRGFWNGTVALRPSTRSRNKPQIGLRRFLSTSTNPRFELEDTLLELQKQFPNFVSISRLQLALQGLRQDAGNEIVRVAVLGVANGPNPGTTARRILRALLADPLQEEQPWERELENRDETKPLIVRVGPPQKHAVSLEIEKATGLDEMHISSPELDGFNLEFLLMEVAVPHGAPGETSIQRLEDAVLVPTVDIPSANGVSSMSTPVHQALLVADGLLGAVNIAALPVSGTNESITAAVQIPGVNKEQLQATFDVVDVSLAEKGINLFRQGPQNAIDYERLWFSSNVPTLLKWLKDGAKPIQDNETKPAVRRLIASMLQDTSSQIQLAEARKLSKALTLKSDDPAVAALNKRLADWAEKAHAELQDELDLAFEGRRWRKLGWWKLFWRVDDVAMLTNEMLSQRFMPTAEQELVYLTGRIAQMGGASPEYTQPKSSLDALESRKLGSGERAPPLAATSSYSLPKWPGHIAFTRRYLQNETVPALQSLAQRLVMQSLGTSGLATSLAALLYISSCVSTVYEAGAVAALGIVYSLGRLQKKWDAARAFWQGEVREEGRKAVRGAEESVATVLESNDSNGAEETGELQETKELVARAEDALARMK